MSSPDVEVTTNAAEWRSSVDLAAATRMLVDGGILGYSGHLSCRSEDGTSVLIQPVSDVRAELLPARILKVTLDGTVVGGRGRPPSELAIHTEIYRARPDVRAVAHFHHDPTTVYSVVQDRPIVAVKNHASRWRGGVPVHPDPSHISSEEQGSALARTLGSCHAAILRAHGEVVVAEGVRALFTDVVHFVENAAALAQAHLLGVVVPLTEAEMSDFESTFDRDSHAKKVWKYHVAVATRDGRIPPEWYPEMTPAESAPDLTVANRR